MKRYNKLRGGNPINPLARAGITLGTLSLAAAGALLPALAESQPHDPSTATVTPIKHVIVIVGENRTFDQVFGAFKPRAGQRVSNLLSRGIITADGKPGPPSRSPRKTPRKPSIRCVST